MKLIAWLLLACVPAGVAAQRHFTVNGRSIDTRTFDAQVKQMMDDIGIPGVSLAIIDKGRIVYYNSYGYKRSTDKKKVNRKTIFEAASLSKSYLVYVAFKLVEEGKLDLDKPVYQYLDNDQLKHDPRYKLITARMILSHSSGIENWKSMNNPDTLEIISDPGKKFVYSGEGYNYLARVIKQLLHEPYDQYVPEMVNEPLGLKRSFYKFSDNKKSLFHKHTPENYAYGHDIYGNPYGKWRNHSPVPSSANNITAKDYATLMLAIFDRRHFSDQTVNTILTPVVRTGANNFPSFYGTGFEIYYPGNDTIVGHGGDNLGFKGQAFYSIVSRSGFVFLDNCENGKLLTTQLNKLTAGLDIDRYYAENFPFQYPSNAVSLFKTYRKEGMEAMLAELEKLKAKGNIGENTLTSLAWFVKDRDAAVSVKLLEENTQLYPQYPMTYGFLGEAYMGLQRYDLARRNYVKAKELHFRWWDNDQKLLVCDEKIREAAKRAELLVAIPAQGGSAMQAESYNAMQGIETGTMNDTEGPRVVVHMDGKDWSEYKVSVTVPGTYILSIRVAGLKPGNVLEVHPDTAASVRLPIEPKGWEKWTTISTNVDLAAGVHTLRLSVGAADETGFNINWIRLDRAQTAGGVAGKLQN